MSEFTAAMHARRQTYLPFCRSLGLPRTVDASVVVWSGPGRLSHPGQRRRQALAEARDRDREARTEQPRCDQRHLALSAPAYLPPVHQHL